MYLFSDHQKALRIMGDYRTQSNYKNYLVSNFEISDDDLKKLKNNYKLDRIYSNNEFECQIKIMRWVHEHMIYNKRGNYSGKLSALYILKYIKDKKEYLNCICHAVVLTQCLLSMGFYARYISCLPMDGLPFDNHVVTEVYSKKEKKWILLDATTNSYFVDENGTILSLVDLRKCLIYNKKIKFVYYDRFQNVGKKSDFGKVYNEKTILEMYIKNMYVLEYYGIYGATFDDSLCYRLIPPFYMQSGITKTIYTMSYPKTYTYTDCVDNLYYNPIEVKI